jgi:nickel-dependent lactate racemase
MLNFAEGSKDAVITQEKASALLDQLIASWGEVKNLLVIPPDFTRFHSWAGELTVWLYEKLKDSTTINVLPALGTHSPMTSEQIARMYPGIPTDLFLEHDWRNGLQKLGEISSERISELSRGKVSYSVNCEINQRICSGEWDRIVSVGQVVPHEVIGMANHSKNIFVGTGGRDTINKSHYLGAVCGMESIMGRAESPVRSMLSEMAERFTAHLPITYLLTVRSKNRENQLVTRGLYAGEGLECYKKAAALAQEVNLNFLDEPLKKAVVYLDPGEFKSTWLGDKAIYRTRMAMADDGELVILAPGLKEFGEDPEIDRLIRKYGYHGTPQTLQHVENDPELQVNLSAAAHLIHGSSEGRFRVIYCPGELTREEIEGVGYEYAPLEQMLERYNPDSLNDGPTTMPDGEEVFYVSNPALGLWALRSAFF